MGLDDWANLLKPGDFERIIRMPRIMVMPLADSPGLRWFGAGVSRLLIRDLSLVRGLAVRGPEDTPK